MLEACRYRIAIASHELVLMPQDPGLEEIIGIEIKSQTADVEDGEIQRYKTTSHVVFKLQR